MVMLVHLSPERAVRAIRRSGIRVSYCRNGTPNGVYAMPVMPDFFLTHQWLRELKSKGDRSIVGVYFRLAGDEPVFIGHYNRTPTRTTASQAVKLLRECENALGYELIVPRKIFSREIHKIRTLPQVVGWRYHPEVRETEFCGCPMCVPAGSIKSRRKRDRWEQEQLPDEGDKG